MGQESAYAAVQSASHGAHNAAIPRHTADFFHRPGDEGVVIPPGGAAADVQGKIPQDQGAFRVVLFDLELRAIQRQAFMGIADDGFLRGNHGANLARQVEFPDAGQHPFPAFHARQKGAVGIAHGHHSALVSDIAHRAA